MNPENARLPAAAPDSALHGFADGSGICTAERTKRAVSCMARS